MLILTVQTCLYIKCQNIKERADKMGFKKDTKMFDNFSKYRVVCKCSHTVTIVKADRIICNHCGNWIYRTPQIEFKYKMMKKMKGMNDKNENRSKNN